MNFSFKNFFESALRSNSLGAHMTNPCTVAETEPSSIRHLEASPLVPVVRINLSHEHVGALEGFLPLVLVQQVDEHQQRQVHINLSNGNNKQVVAYYAGKFLKKLTVKITGHWTDTARMHHNVIIQLSKFH